LAGRRNKELSSLEKLYGPFVLLGRGERRKRSQVSALACLHIFLSGVKPVFARFDFSDHEKEMPLRSPWLVAKPGTVYWSRMVEGESGKESFRFLISAFRRASNFGSVTMRAWRRADRTGCLRCHEDTCGFRHKPLIVLFPVRCRGWVGLRSRIPDIRAFELSVTCSVNREFPGSLLLRLGRANLPLHRFAGGWRHKQDRSFV
jgi:hypothetical protein